MNGIYDFDHEPVQLLTNTTDVRYFWFGKPQHCAGVRRMDSVVTISDVSGNFTASGAVRLFQLRDDVPTSITVLSGGYATADDFSSDDLETSADANCYWQRGIAYKLSAAGSMGRGTVGLRGSFGQLGAWIGSNDCRVVPGVTGKNIIFPLARIVRCRGVSRVKVALFIIGREDQSAGSDDLKTQLFSRVYALDPYLPTADWAALEAGFTSFTGRNTSRLIEVAPGLGTNVNMFGEFAMVAQPQSDDISAILRVNTFLKYF